MEGPGGSFLSHIASQTRAKIFLRGQGSGNIEPTSKRESFEALHIYISHSNQSGMDSACKLCESLIDTVKTELDSFMAAQQTQQPLGYGGNASYASGRKLGHKAKVVAAARGGSCCCSYPGLLTIGNVVPCSEWQTWCGFFSRPLLIPTSFSQTL